jgi:hypothetical protein
MFKLKDLSANPGYMQQPMFKLLPLACNASDITIKISYIGYIKYNKKRRNEQERFVGGYSCS